MRLSWLIPVRDGGPWLAEAVASAAAQLGPRDELLVVDDGSVDGAVAALRPRPGLRVLRQAPLGLVAALERGRAEARGAFIARLDADDRALPGRAEAQLAALEADPGLGAVGGQAAFIGEAGPGMRRYVEGLNALTDPGAHLLVESPLFHPAATIRAEALAGVGGWREGDFPEDYALWLDLAAAGWRLANLPVPVLALRDHPGRLTRTHPRYRRAAFQELAWRFLARTALASPSRVAVWGAGRTGRSWVRRLTAAGHSVERVVDLFPRGAVAGRPVQPPEALAEARVALLLFAVNLPEARAEARRRLPALRPAWREGRDWWAVA